MPKIHVHKAFRLQTSMNAWTPFEPGVHDVSEEVAGHWYTREHASVLEDAPEATKQAEDAEAVGETEGEVAESGSDEAGDDPDDGAGDAAQAPDFDAMSEEELRAYLKERDGKSPHPKTGREKLLIAAKGDAA